MSSSFKRFAPLVSLVGTVVLLAGSSLDAIQHRVNPEAALRGGIASPFNPAHFIPAIGIALCVGGALLWLLGRAGGSGVSFLGRTAFVGTAGVVALLAFVSLLLTASALLRGHETGHAGDQGDIRQISATVAEQEAAEKLVSDTETGAARFEDFEVARAEDYQQMRGKRGKQPGPSRPRHFLNKEYVEDGRVLDPERPEGLMYMDTRDEGMALIGVMYVAPRGEGPADGGELTQWHTHDRLCVGYDEAGAALVSLKLGGCSEGSSPASDIEMMHVWLFDHPDGPLAPHLKPKDALAMRDAEL